MQVFETHKKIESMFERIQELKERSVNITSTIHNVKVQTSRRNDKLASNIACMVDLQNELVRKTDKLINLQSEVMHKIDSLENDDYRLLLTLRYLNFKPWNRIADEMGFTYSWIHRTHERALKAFEPLIQTERG